MNGTFELECHQLDSLHRLYSGRLPKHLSLSGSQFLELWNEHPEEYHEITIHGRRVKTPRWQQAYGKDYHYTGRTNAALPMLPILAPILAWFQEHVDPRLNGVLVNWYDGSLGHYIGRHRDSRNGMIVGSPIVTISFGETRTFRIRRWRSRNYRNFTAADGAVFVMPFETNLAYTHEVPHRANNSGKRVSVTLRAFET